MNQETQRSLALKKTLMRGGAATAIAIIATGIIVGHPWAAIGIVGVCAIAIGAPVLLNKLLENAESK